MGHPALCGFLLNVIFRPRFRLAPLHWAGDTNLREVYSKPEHIKTKLSTWLRNTRGKEYNNIGF